MKTTEKIAVINDKNLKILIEEFTGKEIYFFICREKKEDILENLLNDEISVVIVDETLFNFYETLMLIKRNGIKIVLAGFEIKPSVIKNCQRYGIVDDYLDKAEYIEIEKMIEELYESKDKNCGILKSDESMDRFIDINEIFYIKYDRISKKSIIVTKEDEYSSKKNLSEIEELLKENKKFYRIERGAIINVSKIREIDYRNEYILFSDGKKIFLGSRVLREFKKNVIEENYIELI